MGAIDSMSIGYMPKVYEIDEETGVRSLKAVDLWETSFVNFPMNERATVESVKGAIASGTFSKRQLEEILRDAGFSRQQSKAIVADGFSGLKHRDDADDLNDDIEKLIEAIA